MPFLVYFKAASPDATMALIESLQDEVKKLREETKTPQSTEAALAQVRNLAAKSDGVDGAVLLSAMEGLADAATVEGHGEAEFYRSAAKECRAYEKRAGLRLLVTRLVGTNAAKKVATSVDAWRKASGASKEKEEKDKDLATAASVPLAGMMPFPGMHMYPYFPPMSSFMGSRGSFSRGRGGNMGGRGGFKKRGCFLCGSHAHLMRDCTESHEARVKKD